MTNQDTLLILDIDGVITDPESKQGDQKVLQRLAEKLNNNELLAFNTGRSAEWVNKVILPGLGSHNISNLFCVCEMGYVTMEFDHNNNVQEKVFNENIIPTDLRGAISDIIASSYSDSMFVDETKKVILTIEMRDGFSQPVYEELQTRLSGEIKIILKHYHPGIHIRPSSTTIAIDVKPIESGKALGASRIIDWLKSRQHNPELLKYATIGDSVSDSEMSEWLHSSGYVTNFVYVGNENIGQYDFNVTQTIDKFTKGTLEYLSSLD